MPLLYAVTTDNVRNFCLARQPRIFFFNSEIKTHRSTVSNTILDLLLHFNLHGQNVIPLLRPIDLNRAGTFVFVTV